MYRVCYNNVGGENMTTYTEARKKANMKYIREKTDDIRLRVPKGTKARWQKAAKATGKSMTQCVIEAVNNYFDDIFCRSLLEEYENLPDDKHEAVGLEEFAKTVGVTL